MLSPPQPPHTPTSKPSAEHSSRPPKLGHPLNSIVRRHPRFSDPAAASARPNALPAASLPADPRARQRGPDFAASQSAFSPTSPTGVPPSSRASDPRPRTSAAASQPAPGAAPAVKSRPPQGFEKSRWADVSQPAAQGGPGMLLWAGQLGKSGVPICELECQGVGGGRPAWPGMDPGTDACGVVC